MSLVSRLVSCLVCSACMILMPDLAVASPRQATPRLQVEIARVRQEILNLEKDIAEKQAEWDKLYAEYLRIMNTSGGRPGPNLRMKVNRLDADARKIKADIDAQERVLEATELHLLSLEEELEKRESAVPEPPMQRPQPRIPETPSGRRPEPTAPSDPAPSDSTEPESVDMFARPSSSRRLLGILPMIDLTDPVGAGGATAAIYRIEAIVEKFGDEKVDRAAQFLVQFDSEGMASHITQRFDHEGSQLILSVETTAADRIDFSREGGHWTVRPVRSTSAGEDMKRMVFRRFDSDGDELESVFWHLLPAGNSFRLQRASSESPIYWLRDTTIVHSLLPAIFSETYFPDIGGSSLQVFAGRTVDLEYYPSGRVGAVRLDDGFRVAYSYGDEGQLASIDVHAKGALAQQTAKLLCTEWDGHGRWTKIDVFTEAVQRPGQRERNVLARSARVTREFGGEVTASSFVRREFNVLPPRRGPSAGLPAEGPGLLSNSAPSSGTQVTTQVEASRAGMSQPAGAPAAVAAPREIPIDSPPTGRGASALEREGASLLAIGLCAVLLVIGGGVIWLIAAGYSDIIIIFDDWADFGLSFLAAFCVIVGFAVAVVSLRPDGTWTGFLASLAVIAAGIAAGYRSFTLAFNNNGKGALGVTVGVFKIFAGLLIVVGIFGHGSTLLDRKARVSEQIRSAILLAAFTALAYALVNGKRVREKRAASMAGAAAAAP